MANTPKRVAFFLCPGYGAISFVCAVEVLRAASNFSEQSLYDWRVISADGGPVAASNGIETLTEKGPDNPADFDLLIICAGFNPHKAIDAHALSWVRSVARHGAQVAGISTGAWVMAEAGLLNGYRCAIHWENAASFVEAFPEIDLTQSVFEVDRDRYTCAGGTSSLDLMLHLVASEHGTGLATEIARYYHHERIRGVGDLQAEARDMVIRIKSVKLLKAITLMEANLEQPLQTDELAGLIGITTRQMQRLFKEHTGKPPNRFYLDLRLRHARLLLLQTTMPVIDIAIAAGFVSHAHFSKCYRQLFQVTPSEERRKAF